MREWIARLADWMRRDRLDDELREELRFHRAQLERDARSDGAAPDDAHRRARRELGNITRVAEQARDRWSIPWLDHFQQDVGYAVRVLRRSPTVTITVVLTLGLGIGADVAMFSVVDRLMFRPFAHLRDPGSVDRVYLSTVWAGDATTYTVFPYARYLDLRRWTTSFSDFAAFVSAMHGVGTGDAARERAVAGVTASFFDFFDARPALGRFFAASEDSAYASTNVAVLGYDFWNVEYARRNPIGESISVGNAK
jgi:putative ABC transport system permease protein